MKRKSTHKKTAKATLIKNPIYAFAGLCNIASALLFHISQMQQLVIYSLILSGLALLILSISENR